MKKMNRIGTMSSSHLSSEIIVDLIVTGVFTSLIIIISLLNYFSTDSLHHFDIYIHEQQDKTESDLTQVSTTTNLSSMYS